MKLLDLIRSWRTPRVRALSYEAGATGRRLGRWQPGYPGPNSSILGDLDLVRSRSRDQVRNNAWISRGVKSWEANEVGCGITLKSAAPDDNWRKLADDLWERQGRYMDADGIYDINGMMRLIVRTRRAGGEIFIRRRPRQLSDGLPVPIQYQLLEPEFCPVNYNDTNVSGGRRIYAGIEFNGIGKRTAYWMYRSHPGDAVFSGGFDSQLLTPIPAASILHHYEALRPGQIRGMPAIVQAMIKAKETDEYDDAELVRKKNRSAFTGMIRRPQWSEEDYKFDPMTGQPIEKDQMGVPITDVQSGQFFIGLPGEDVTLFDGDNTGSGYADFIRQQILGIGAGMDVPYEFLSGDFSKLNDRTLRVVLAEYHRTIEQDRWLLTIPQVCVPMWEDFIDYAIMAGALPAPADYASNREAYLKVTCHPEGWPYLHELQDANAAITRIKGGLSSRKRELSELGIDVREVDDENAEDQARAEQLDLNYESTVTPPPDSALSTQDSALSQDAAAGG